VTGQTSIVKTDQPLAGFTLVSNDYFATLGIRVVEGRVFGTDVTESSPPVVVVNESLARHFWPNESAIGKRIASGDGDQRAWREIIGVVPDVTFAANVFSQVTSYQVYRPLVQEPWGYIMIGLRTESPDALKRDLKTALVDIDPDIAAEQIYTVPEAVASFQSSLTVARHLMEVFALLGTLLAAVGLYGVISHTVAQRMSEFGIRMALGAQARDVLGLVMKDGLQLTVIGAIVGLVVGYGVSHVLMSFMPGLSGTMDPVGIMLVAGLLFLVSMLAILFPALRATRVDPVSALRAE
jgi:ABC-type antimicrobial peptide transport system permease subunit